MSDGCAQGEHLDGVGDGLRKAGKAFDRAVGSYERMLVPGARRLSDLGAGGGKEVPEIAAGEGPARQVAPPGDGPAALPPPSSPASV
jgi:hypothetical protein